MMFLKLRFSFHQFMSKYNEALMEDAICPDLKKKLAAKASWHKRKVNELTEKPNVQDGKMIHGERESLALKNKVS